MTSFQALQKKTLRLPILIAPTWNVISRVAVSLIVHRRVCPSGMTAFQRGFELPDPYVPCPSDIGEGRIARVLHRLHYTSSQPSPPLTRCSIVGDGCVGPPSIRTDLRLSPVCLTRGLLGFFAGVPHVYLGSLYLRASDKAGDQGFR